jgi:ribosomal protein S18 acetylase RimI-like enzyme
MQGRRADRRPGLATRVIRAGSIDDRAFVEDLGKRTALTSISAQRQAPRELVLASFDRMLSFVYDQSHVLLIAEESGLRQGFLLFLDTLPDEVTGGSQAFIAYMAVEPSARGQGVGKALLSAAEDEARRRGLPYMALMVTEDNAAAREVYQSAGFQTERRLLCKRL